MNKKITLEDRLKKYAALAGGLTAVAGGVNAQVIYTDVDPDSVVTGDGSLFAVDFNGDSNIDITFTTKIDSSSFYSSSSSWSSFTTNKVDATLPGGINEGWMGAAGAVGNNGAGAAISAGAAFATGIGSLANVRMYTSASGGPYTVPNGAFLGTEGYVGVKFDIGGSAHFGWVRVSVSSDGTILTVKDYAYEATAGVAINAGDIGTMGAPTITQTANIGCGGDLTGEIVAAGNGGVGPYTYSWTDAAMSVVGTDATLSNVGAGTYEVTVTDALLNTVSSSFTITEPLALSTTLSSTEDSGADDGTINLGVVGGSSPYTFDWDNDGTGDFDDTEDLSGLASGTYNVVVQDANNCTVNASETVIHVLSTPTIAQNASNLCSGDAIAEIEATPVNGSGPYSYSWTDASMNVVGTDAVLSNLAAGTYEVTVTDASLNTASETFTVPEPLQMSASTTVIDETFGNDGEIDLSVTGGTTPFTFAWDNSETTEDLNGLTSGTYTVTVTDANGCTVMASDSVASTVGIEENASIISKVFPNPTTGRLNIELGDVTGTVEVSILDVAGRVLVTDSKENPSKINMDLSQFSTGVYSVIVKAENRSTEVKIIKE